MISPKWWNRQGGVGGAAGSRALQGSFAQPWGSLVSFSRPGDVAVLLHRPLQRIRIGLTAGQQSSLGQRMGSFGLDRKGMQAHTRERPRSAAPARSHASQSANLAPDRNSPTGGSQEGMEVEGYPGHGGTPWAAAQRAEPVMGSTWHNSAPGIGSLGTIVFALGML